MTVDSPSDAETKLEQVVDKLKNILKSNSFFDIYKIALYWLSIKKDSSIQEVLEDIETQKESNADLDTFYENAARDLNKYNGL